MPVNWDDLAKFVIQAVKDSMDENISALFLADVEHPNDGLPYFIIRFDERQYHALVNEREKLKTKLNNLNNLLNLHDQLIAKVEKMDADSTSEQAKRKQTIGLQQETLDQYQDIRFKMGDCEKAIAAFDDFSAELEAQGKNSKKLPVTQGGIVQYQYFITPSELDQLLSERTRKYSGYRDGMSVLHLEKRNAPAYIPGRILLSPAADLDGLVLLRSAGCNTSSMISTQLAFLIQDLAPQDTSSKSKFSYMYGHHEAPFAAENLGVNGSIIFDAMEKCLGGNHSLSHQSEKGFTEIKRSADSLFLLEPMTEDSKRIYKIFSAVRPNELDQPESRSIEVNTVDFLDKLVEAMKEKIKIYEEEDDDDDLDYGQGKMIQELNKGIGVLQEVKAKLSASNQNKRK